MSGYDLPGARFYGPVRTRVSSSDQPPRYFLGKQTHALRARGRASAHLTDREVGVARRWAQANPQLSLSACVDILIRRYPIGKSTAWDILSNRTCYDPAYVPVKRVRASTAAVEPSLTLWMRLVLWVWMLRREAGLVALFMACVLSAASVGAQNPTSDPARVADGFRVATEWSSPTARVAAVAPIALAPTDVLAFGFCDPASSWNSNRWFAVDIDGVRQLFSGPLIGDTAAGANCYQTQKAFSFPSGTHAVAVSLINHCNATTDPDPMCQACARLAGCNPLVDVPSMATVLTVVSQTTGPDCAVPLGAEAVSVFVTQWAPGSGRTVRAGTDMHVDYWLASKSPINDIRVLVDGIEVSRQAWPGADLTRFQSTRFTAPAVGKHKLAVRATNTAGCTGTGTSGLDLTVQK